MQAVPVSRADLPLIPKINLRPYKCQQPIVKKITFSNRNYKIFFPNIPHNPY
jgi:hypothetical protein